MKSVMNTTETIQLEEKKALPLESLPPLPAVDSGKEWEKTQYWSRLLTGDPADVPDEVRRKVEHADAPLPPQEQNYRLVHNINRSWLVDHSDLNREQVRSAWPELRRRMAQNLGVRDSEDEIYAGLSLQHAEQPTRQKVRDLYTRHYEDALKGKTFQRPETQDDLAVCEDAFRQGALVREECMPLAENISDAWELMKAQESTPYFSFPAVLRGMPGLVQAVDALADMEPEDRARVYAVARSLDSTRELEEKPGNLGEAMLQSMRRGATDLGHSALQGIGHVGTALVKGAGETFNSNKLRDISASADKRLQVLDELRRIAQGELFPIDLGEEAGLAEQMAVDAASAVPGAALAFMGGAGFGALTLAGTGAAVAEARRRSPEGRQELQVAAGILGGALQAGIYMGMSRIGARMLDRTIKDFLKAGSAGVKGYSLAALKGLGTLTLENAKLLLAGKAAQAAELGVQELAARVDNVASNIDWESFGDDFTDIEANMREAAMNLPFVLIAAGRAALHHFRSPSALLDNGELLAEWGVDEASRRQILQQQNIHVQNDMLREALCKSERWGGTGNLELLLRSLKLLNTEHHIGFREEKTARSFLRKRPDYPGLAHPKLKEPDVANPETREALYERGTGRKTPPLNADKAMPYLLMMDEWYQRAGGDKAFSPHKMKERAARHFEIVKDGKFGIPKHVQLNGLYNPNQETASRAIFNDAIVEVNNLTYRYLLNTESLDSLRRSYKSEKDARAKTEARRYRIHSELCAAIHRWLLGEPRKQVLDDLCETIGGLYDSRQHHTHHKPLWFRKVKREMFFNCYERACKKFYRPSRQDDPNLLEAYRIILGIRACAETLMEVIPHTRDFQDALTMGYSPQEIYTHMLRREFNEKLDLSVWNPKLLIHTTPEMGDNRHRLMKNQRKIKLYSELTGRTLESTPGGDGKKLWRMKRPDGSYTHWFDAPGYAVNSLVGNVETSFLPMGKNKLFDELSHARVMNEGYKLVHQRRRMFPLLQDSYLGFDHLGNSATRDLCALWKGDATLYRTGLEFATDVKNWIHYGGRRLDSTFKVLEGESDRYLVRHNMPMTPLSLAQMSFKVHWGRLMTSGWVSPAEVADLLLEEGYLTQNQYDRMITPGLLSRIDDGQFVGRVRRGARRQQSDRRLGGDYIGMCNRLADAMSRLNVVYMLADLQNAPLPDSVKQWFCTTPFSEWNASDIKADRHERFLKANRQAAEDVKELIPRIQAMRRKYNKENPIPLERYFRNAFEPEPSRRYEQGWCFALGGERPFRSAGQPFWNLLEAPERAWPLLPVQDRRLISTELAGFFGERPTEELLSELQDVLQRYPEIRAYGMARRDDDALYRMKLAPIRSADIVDPVYTKKGNRGVYDAESLECGYTMEHNAELPENLRNDERVLPAIRILSELRRSVAQVPYVDAQGIWWNLERYGGKTGKRPHQVDESWSVETGLEPLVDYYSRVADIASAAGQNGELTVCGVQLGGIRPGELDSSSLKHVTVYRSELKPEHMIRLMPGEPDSGHPTQRAPYVVHTADGIPLYPNRMARDYMDIHNVLTPLPTFRSNLERAYDYDSNKGIRKAYMLESLYRLIRSRGAFPYLWRNGNERNINNKELFMQIFQDSRLPYYLARKDPRKLTRGEALTSELCRLSLLAEYGVDKEANIAKLVNFCTKLIADKDDIVAVHEIINRVVSPDPEHYKEEEKTPQTIKAFYDRNHKDVELD